MTRARPRADGWVEFTAVARVKLTGGEGRDPRYVEAVVSRTLYRPRGRAQDREERAVRKEAVELMVRGLGEQRGRSRAGTGRFVHRERPALKRALRRLGEERAEDVVGVEVRDVPGRTRRSSKLDVRGPSEVHGREAREFGLILTPTVAEEEEAEAQRRRAARQPRDERGRWVPRRSAKGRRWLRRRAERERRRRVARRERRRRRR